jgi:hypothetical protein
MAGALERESTLRPSAIVWSVIGLIIAIDLLGVTLIIWTQAEGGKPWHYWIAPVMALQAVMLLALLAFGYFWKVGRLEARGRPRSE